MATRDSEQKEALSVSAVVALGNSIFEKHRFTVLGEVSEYNNKNGYASVYFTIKDEGAVLPCRMWKNRFDALKLDLTIGSKVEIKGFFSVYAKTGRMSFEVNSLKLAGDGVLRAQVAQLADKLTREGLTDSARKRSLPLYPEVVGLVTSPRGSVVHDVLRNMRKRFPYTRILFAGVPVEGKTAANDMIRGIDTVVTAGAEFVILARGGGSFEEFMPFNDENLARAIAACPVPVVTGIGHEPDTTIADLVSDKRCSTPNGVAAEVVPFASEVHNHLNFLFSRMTTRLKNRLNSSETYLNNLASRPVVKDPMTIFRQDAQHLDYLQERLARELRSLLPSKNEELFKHRERIDAALTQRISQDTQMLDTCELRIKAYPVHMLDGYRAKLTQNERALRTVPERLINPLTQQVDSIQGHVSRTGKTLTQPFANGITLQASRLNDLSPLKVLERGWSFSKTQDGEVVRSISQVKPRQSLSIQVTDGRINCEVSDVVEAPLFDTHSHPTKED